MKEGYYINVKTYNGGLVGAIQLEFDPELSDKNELLNKISTHIERILYGKHRRWGRELIFNKESLRRFLGEPLGQPFYKTISIRRGVE